MQSVDEILSALNEKSEARFREQRTILSFAEYLELLLAHPYRLTRNVAQYATDMMDFYGSETVDGMGQQIRRFKVFDDEEGGGRYRVVGQERVQNEIYRCLREFIQRRQVDRMLLLHGPNGSSKTTIVQAFTRGLETYSCRDEGMLLRFNWVFSESDDQGERLGFSPVGPDEDLDSFAHLPPDRISAKIPCELNENPIFLIPRAERTRLLAKAIEDAKADGGDHDENEAFVETRFLSEGDLSPKSRRIYESLLSSYHGDWRRVIRHVQVERFYINKRYRSAAVTIEPQGNMDASSRQIGHATVNGLPPVLQNEALFEAVGDLVDANGGIVEYSDFLKRPIEANKYLLTTAENGTMNLPNFSALLNVLLVGTSNESYLSAFRRDPMFSSFKARLELIRVPYLLRFSQEQELYERQLEKLPGHIHVAPHTTEIAALWAVLTRLMEPYANLEDETLRKVVSRLSPLQKAKLYDRGELPRDLNNEERNLLRSHIPTMSAEYDKFEAEFEGTWDAAYEGRRGASAREMSTLLSEVAISPSGDCISALSILKAIPDLMKEAALYEFLRLKPSRNHYHECERFLAEIESHLGGLIRIDVLQAADMVEDREYDRLLSKYLNHLRAHKTSEKVHDASTGRDQDPDLEFMARIEKLMDLTQDIESARTGMMTRVAVYRLEHPEEDIVFGRVFDDLRRKLEENVFLERLQEVQKLVTDVLVLEGARAGSLDDESQAVASKFRDRMCNDLGYIPYSMIEALEFFHSQADR
ncbi:MAG: hypothetical protein V3W41_05155 [Planctomycetota bacterium]